MDGRRFDGLARSCSRFRSRREALAALAGIAVARPLPPAVGAQACLPDGDPCRHPTECCAGGCKKKKGKKKGTCACPGKRQCSDALCCPDQAACCNPGAESALCCAAPGTCAPLFDPSNPTDRLCCPPERTVQFSGAQKCCPEGEVAIDGQSSSGPCCPAARVCETADDPCCPLGSTCIDGECCAESGDGSACCQPGHAACNGQCCAEVGQTCCGGAYCCGTNDYIC